MEVVAGIGALLVQAVVQGGAAETLVVQAVQEQQVKAMLEVTA